MLAITTKAAKKNSKNTTTIKNVTAIHAYTTLMNNNNNISNNKLMPIYDAAKKKHQFSHHQNRNRNNHINHINNMNNMNNMNNSTGMAFFSSTSSLTTDDEEEHPNFLENEKAYRNLTQQALIHDVTHSQQSSAETVIPWFLETMPSSYFRTVNEESRMQHLRAITCLHDSGHSQGTVVLRSKTPEGRNEITFIRPGNYPGMLTEMLDQLPPAGSFLSRVKVFTSSDNTMALNIFGYGKEKEACPKLSDCKHLLEYAQELQSGAYLNDANAPSPCDSFEEEELKAYITNKCTEFFVTNSHPRRFLIHKKLFDQVKGTESVAAHLEKYTGEPITANVYGENLIREHHDSDSHDHDHHTSKLEGSRYWVSLAMGNVLPHLGLQSVSNLLNANNMDLLRVHLDLVDDPDNDNSKVTMLRVLVQDNPSSDIALDDHSIEVGSESRWSRLKKDLCRLKWLDNETIELSLENFQELSLENAEIITALSNVVHGPLSKIDFYKYTTTNIYADVSNKRYLKHGIAIADLFRDRFDPRPSNSNNDMNMDRGNNGMGMSENEFLERCEKIQSQIHDDVEESRVAVLFNKMLDVVKATYRTNLFMTNRYALGLRINPDVMNGPGDETRESPYGVFYVHGRRFNGFHCRFREIARGGLRIVTPPTKEAVAVESSRHYDEVYGLSYAQQLKNKDIPEGGSKAVVLCDVNQLSANGKEFAKRKAVKAFTDTILDLIVDTSETKANIVDHWGKPEILYFGPDEQIIPDDINWVIKRAGERSYPIPSAFMSSKPDAGINHKVYGVTSEGVAVFLKHGLLQQGINPKKDKFTIKITGGPDGDVAGNIIKILNRDYGTNPIIIGISDGTGCAEDPQGLDHEELLRLFNQEAGICEFNQEKLSSEGKFYSLDNEEGIKMRNTMHNRLEADAFVPGGGRPYTMNKLNWQDFLLPDGRPSSKLIVEGANLFLTQEAREELYKNAGVTIVKDSSANKCGVICSSFEIVSCMLLSQSEFTDVKDELVEDVLVKLKNFAEQEAELLFRELELNPATYLPDFSQRISNAMNLVKDAVAQELDQYDEEEFKRFYPILKAHLPDTLAHKAFDRFQENVPFPYAKNIIASSLATKIVYGEGVSFIEEQGKSKTAVGRIALKYLNEETSIAELKIQLMEAEMDEESKDLIYKILDKGGVRTKLMNHLGENDSS